VTGYPHLSETTAEKLELSDADRIRHIKKPRWISYARAKSVLDKLEDLLEHPDQARMPNMLVIGETNNGKTAIVTRFRDQHPPDTNITGEAVKIPVLYIQAPPGPDEAGLYTVILDRLFEAYPRAESKDARRNRVISVLRRVDLGMIMVDEIHHLMAGSYVNQRNCLNVLKYLGNELRVPLVGIGTAEALRAVQTDPQLSNRFTPELLPRWKAGEPELYKLLASFERILPLKKPSLLQTRPLASLIVDLCDGTIGEMSTLLNAAAVQAIKSSTEQITQEVIARCGYVGPAQRKQVGSLL